MLNKKYEQLFYSLLCINWKFNIFKGDPKGVSAVSELSCNCRADHMYRVIKEKGFFSGCDRVGHFEKKIYIIPRLEIWTTILVTFMYQLKV